MGSFPETYNDPKGKLGRVWKAPSSSPPPLPDPLAGFVQVASCLNPRPYL